MSDLCGLLAFMSLLYFIYKFIELLVKDEWTSKATHNSSIRMLHIQLVAIYILQNNYHMDNGRY